MSGMSGGRFAITVLGKDDEWWINEHFISTQKEYVAPVWSLAALV